MWGVEINPTLQFTKKEQQGIKIINILIKIIGNFYNV